METFRISALGFAKGAGGETELDCAGQLVMVNLRSPQGQEARAALLRGQDF